MGLDRCYTPFTTGLWGAMIFYARETIGRGVPPCRPVHGQDEVLVTA